MFKTKQAATNSAIKLAKKLGGKWKIQVGTYYKGRFARKPFYYPRITRGSLFVIEYSTRSYYLRDDNCTAGNIGVSATGRTIQDAVEKLLQKFKRSTTRLEMTLKRLRK